MKKIMMITMGLGLVLSLSASAKEMLQSGSGRWIVSSEAATKDEAIAEAKERVMALEKKDHAMPSDVNVSLPANYIKGSFKIDNGKFYISEYYNLHAGPFYEVNALFDYTYKTKEYD
ncbi:hypothetical protein [Vibrio owensii]|uniref:hypothetical protein n=1 Tax=Vibrio owensii TaxID=696485 RepID=UPI0018F24D4B|nr:hypothetical protein [Vibrio owensii]